MKDPEVIAAIIAFIGVLLSVIISYIISYQKVKVELRKHKEQIMQNVGQKLFEKRIEIYPILYSIACRYARDLKANTITKTKLQEYYKEIFDWDVNNSIFMSAKTQNLFFLFRVELLNISELSEVDFMNKYGSEDGRKNLRETSKKVELALKNELGIFSYESPDKITQGLKFSSFEDQTTYATVNNKK